jgi:Spy/CpxP family protein refolding chaperone
MSSFMKLIFASLSALLLASGSLLAGDHTCPMANGKMDCSKVYADLNLTPDQKSKMDVARTECEKAGCTQESMDKFLATAKSVLTPEQYAKVEAECARCAKEAHKEVKS